MMDAVDFAGFWLRHQRIGMRNIQPVPGACADVQIVSSAGF
jgi:hypothetical protein